MAETVEFGKAFSRPQPKGLILYTPKSGQSITVRFVGKQQVIYFRWNNETRTAFYFENKIEGSIRRIASFVMDRDDEQIKVYLCPTSIFEQMGKYGKTHDFHITRFGQGIQTQYKVESLGESFISEVMEDRVEVTSKTYPFADILIKKVQWELLDVESEPITDRFDILDL
jgi:hypothetical protein